MEQIGDRVVYLLNRDHVLYPAVTALLRAEDELLRRLHDQGVLLQVNAGSLLTDERRSPSARLGQRLCREGLVHVLASDGHRARDWRPVTELASAFGAAVELVGEPRARWMMSEAPAAIIGGALGALMSFSSSPWYADYAAMGMTGVGLDPVDDQRLAGLIMWIPGGLVHGAAALALAYKWLKASEGDARAALNPN